MVKRTVTFKLISKKDGSCVLFEGRKKIVSHTGKDAREKCLKASKIRADMLSIIRKKRR
jgi:hypothetical protein